MSQFIELQRRPFLPDSHLTGTVMVTTDAGEPFITIEAEILDGGDVVNVIDAAWVDTLAAKPAVDALSFVIQNAEHVVAGILYAAAASYASPVPRP